MTEPEKTEKKEKKERIPRQGMPEQDPKARVTNFDEVPTGYSPETAMLEARRCIQCKKPGCVSGCPVDIDIPAFIQRVADGDFIGAARKIKETNCLPAVCGRVCPQEDQCEKLCVLGKKWDPVAIGRLERFVADYERNAGTIEIPVLPASTGKRIAVIGAGPAGLTIAGDLVKMGHDVTIFEALHKSGGVLIYGIPEFRLPKGIVDAEVEYLQKIGVKIVTDAAIGRLKTIDDLFAEGFHAVFLGVGAGAPVFMNIPGENFSGIYSANEYLTRSNLMKAYRFPEYDTPIAKGRNVVVIGGGNVAMDCARISMRLGAKVCLNYRRSRNELPARREEIENAEEEGLMCNFLNAPVEFFGDDKGWVKTMRCTSMELGEPDDEGRCSVTPIACSDFDVETDTVIVAIGQTPNPIIQRTTDGLKTNSRNGTIIVDEDGRTNLEGVFAGGDVATGAATVISAMGAGKRAARAMHDYLMNGKRGDRE